MVHATIGTLIVPKTQTVPAPLPVHATTADPSGTTPAAPTPPKRWAELLACVFGIDMQKCPDCGAPFLVEKVTKKHGRQLVCNNEDCSYVRSEELAPV